MIPLRDDNPTVRAPIVTVLLILANLAVFVLLQPHGASKAVIELTKPAAIRTQHVTEEQFLYWQAAIPCEITTNQPLDVLEMQASLQGRTLCERDGAAEAEVVFPEKRPFVSALSSMFLHGGWMHLLGNMLFLWIFANNVEDRWGRLRFLGFYLVGGLVALGAHVAASVASTEPIVGASGAVAAVMGAYLVLFPRARVLSLVAIFPLKLPAWFLLGVWFVLQFFTDANERVAWIAHVGGFVFGVLVAIIWRRHRVPVAVDTLAA